MIALGDYFGCYLRLRPSAIWLVLLWMVTFVWEIRNRIVTALILTRLKLEKSFNISKCTFPPGERLQLFISMMLIARARYIIDFKVRTWAGGRG